MKTKLNKGFWTLEHLSALRQLYEQNYTPQEIAIELKTTRNAVIGKLWRLRGKGIKRKPKATPWRNSEYWNACKVER